MNKRKLDNKAKQARFQGYLNKIVFPLLIAAIAIAVSLFMIQFAGSWYQKLLNREAPEIVIGDDGTLSVKIQADDEDLYILWETDGGHLSPVEENDRFAEQYTKDNKGYQLYAQGKDKVVWNPEDADGNRYTTATVAATVYYGTEGMPNYYMDLQYVQTMLAITVTFEDGEVKKEETARYFSNPVREGEDSEWAQIYVLKEEDDRVLYRYRVGSDLSEVAFTPVVCFESAQPVLYETAYTLGMYPKSQLTENAKPQTLLKGKEVVTVLKEDLEDTTEVSAYLIDSTLSENETIDEGDKQFVAGFRLEE